MVNWDLEKIEKIKEKMTVYEQMDPIEFEKSYKHFDEFFESGRYRTQWDDNTRDEAIAIALVYNRRRESR